MATLDNQNDIILQATDYRFVDPLIELATYDSNSATTIITPKFTKTADVAGLLPSLVVIKATMTNTIGTTASLPTPTQYYWEYSTTTNPNTWIAVSPQPTYGVGYNVGTLQVTNALFKTHVGTGNTGVYYRLTLKYAVENDVVGSRFLVSYVAEANTPPLVELSKPTIFIPTTTSTVDFLNSTFDLNVRVGTTYLRYDASVTPAINTFKVGTGVVRVGTTTIGAMTLADRDKATTNLVSANDTAVFADFSGAGTTDFAVLEYPVTITDIDGNTIAISIQQSLVKQKTGQDGLAGTPGALFEITNSAPVFKKTSAGVFSPTSLTLNTQFLYITGTPTYQWYKNNVAISGAVSNNYVVATADYASVATNTYKCTITGTIGGSVDSLSDEVTIPLLADGSNAIQISNSNENITFSGPETGFSGISFTSGGSVIRVYLGTTLLSYAASGANTFSCTIANTGITVAAGTGTGTTFTVPAPTAMSTDTATTVVTVTIRDSEGAVTTPTTTISYSLSRAGADGIGTNGTRTAILEMYRWSATTPTTFPVGTSTYTWSTGQFTAPATLNSWSLTPPASVVGQTLWVCRTVYADTLSTTTTSITWSATAAYAAGAAGTDGDPGVNGTRTAFLELYRWSAATPTTWPTGNSTYTWATGVFTAPATPNSWALVPGASTGGFNLYATSVRYSDTGVTATSAVTWPTTGQVAYVVGAAGDYGSAVYFIDRNTGTASTAPTNAEVTAAIGRNAIVGDIATIRYTASGSITSISYRCTAVTPTWVVQTTYISGSVVVEGSLSASKITSGLATFATTDRFALGGDSVIAAGAAAAEFTTSGSARWGALVQNSSTSGTSAHGLGALTLSTSANAIVAYNFNTNSYNKIRSISTISNGAYGFQTTRYKTSSFTVVDNSAVNGRQESLVTLAQSDGAGYFQKWYPNAVAPGNSNQKWIIYMGNDTQDAAISAARFDVNGTTVTKKLLICTGGYAAVATAGQGKIYAADGYTAFTGAHIGWSNIIIDDGDIVVDDLLISKDTISATNFSQKISTIPNQKGVIGVVSRCEYWFKNISSTYNSPQPTPLYSTDNVERFQEHPEPSFDEDPWYGYDYRLDINALGDGQVNVCGENGDIEIGDLIVTSSMLGKGMRQADDIVRSYTVAKAREAVTFSSPNEVKTIACIYLCG